MFIEGALFKEIVNYALFLQLNEKLSVAQDENRRAFVIWDMGANKAVRSEEHTSELQSH